MEAPHDATKTKTDMLNFSGSASDMMAAMAAAGIVVPDAQEAARKVAAAPPSEPEKCEDPTCGHDHAHSGQDHGHAHAHDHGSEKEEGKTGAACAAGGGCHEHSHEHSHGHGHGHQHDAAAVSPSAAAPSAAAGVVQCLDATASSLTLAWAAAAAKGTIKYELEWRPAEEDGGDGIGGGAAWAKLGSKGFTSGLPPKQKNGLAAGTAFEFRVRGRDAVDWFPFGPVSRHSTLGADTPRLGSAVACTAADTGSLTLSWEPVPGNASEAGYTLQLREEQEPCWTTVSGCVKGVAAKKKGLDPRGKYYARVRPNQVVVKEGGGDEGATPWYYSKANTVAFRPVSPVHPIFPSLLGNQLVSAAGPVAGGGLDRLAGAVVALYFSASWCGPCQQYTPQLVSLYRAARAQGRKFEVVLISADKDEASMQAYLGHMPWLAVPFDAPQRQQTQARFQVSGIPCVKVIGPSGDLLDANAVQSGNLTLPNLALWEQGKGPRPQQSAGNHHAHDHGHAHAHGGGAGGCCGGGGGCS